MPRRFDVAGKKLFLTYPKCPVSQSDALAFLQGCLSVNHYIIARESHSDGSLHLHCYIELTEYARFRTSSFADIVDNGVVYHGNYQGCRSGAAVIEYVTKGADFISDLDVLSLRNGKRPSRADLCDLLVKKQKTLNELVCENPQLLYDYQKLSLNLRLFQEATEEPPVVPFWLPNPWGRVVRYLAPCKRRHYWFYSRRPNCGKTFHFAIPLRDEFGFQIATGDFHYWDVGVNTPGIILDDYNTAKLKWDTIDQLADGTYNFRVAYRGVVKVKKYIVIILSNQTISELYPNTHEFISERFHEVNVDLN